MAPLAGAANSTANGAGAGRPLHRDRLTQRVAVREAAQEPVEAAELAGVTSICSSS